MTDAAPPFDAAEATALYQRCFGELVGYLERLLGERGAAEDCAQEAGLRLIESARREPLPLRQPRAFLFHVATNLARDQLRRRVAQAAAYATVPIEVSAPPADAVAAAREEIAQVQQALGELPLRPRQVLLLARVEGLSHAEIGARLGIAAKTVENHLGRALAALAERLGKRRS
jgi:RNA polymerase sigma factor (sigma-70 family)